MKIPNHESATVPETKLTKYLLSSTHPDGKHKAAYFTAVGFSAENWQLLQKVLLQHVVDHDVVKVDTTEFGDRYVVKDTIHQHWMAARRCFAPCGLVAAMK